MNHHRSLLLFLTALAIFLLMFIRYQRKPNITAINPLVAVSGDSIELTGRFFGDESEGAKLIVGSQTLTSASIIEWNDKRIIVRVPRSDGAVLIKVKTRSGLSNGVVLGDAARFPQVEYGPWLPGTPFIEYIEPGTGAPGTLVTLLGENFGSNRNGGKVWMNQSDTSNPFDNEAPNPELYSEVTAFDVWTDSLISFWIPVHVSSGNAYVIDGSRFSNPIHVEVVSGAGSFETGETVRWSLRQDVKITRIGAFRGNSLYLRIPKPIGNRVSQSEAVILDDNKNQKNTLLHRGKYIDIYQLDELVSGESRKISRQIVLNTSALMAVVDPDALHPYDPTHPELAVSLTVDKWIRPDLVSRISSRVVGTIRDDWRKSHAIFNYVVELLEFSEESPSRRIPEYLSTQLANSEGYSFLFCSLARAALVPARPVGGILIDTDGKSHRWWWAEIWIEGLGWVPVDPAMSDAKNDNAWMGDDDRPPGYYFGGLDERHIAFSRGISESEPLQPNTELRIPIETYTLQGVWEEISGNLYSYSSDWVVPRGVAFYQ